MNYEYIGLVEHADGTLDRRIYLTGLTLIVKRAPWKCSWAFSLLEQKVKRMPVLARQTASCGTSEAVKLRGSQVEWLEEYSDEDFLELQNIIIFPDRLMSEKGLMMGI